MNEYSPNGSGKRESQLPMSMQGKQVKFPVTYMLKAVMDATIDDDVNREHLVAVFKNLNMNYLYSGKKISSRGKYVSFTFKITVVNKIQFEKLYAMLRQVEGLKYAL